MAARPATLALLIAFSVLMPPPAFADCIQMTATQIMANRSYEFVFIGTVVQVSRTAAYGYRATFEVDRVWKGSVTKRFDLHVSELAGEMPQFEVGRHYVALARRLISPKVRQQVGLEKSDAVAFTPIGCSDAYSLAPNIIRDLGVGQPPK